jgi:hypothetical protein
MNEEMKQAAMEPGEGAESDRPAVSSGPGAMEPKPPESAETAPGQPAALRRSRFSGSVGWWVVAVFLVLLFLVALRAYLGVEGLFREVVELPGEIVEEWRSALPPQPTPTIEVLPPALDQVRSMARLQTTSFFLSTVVEANRPPNWPGTGQRLLLVAYGKVTAGVDLSLITEEDVQIIGKRVVLNLPEAEIFDAFLDEEGTYVYDYEKGLFARFDATLESQARERALEEFRSTALENGILMEAQRQAEWEVQRLLQLLGYESVDFR